MYSVNKSRYEKSLKNLYTIFQDISKTTNQVSRQRCPYKNVKSNCTASFGCRNQKKIVKSNQYYLKCIGSDNLNYQDAWQNSPITPASK
tara:strand:- start:6008 stop:6274 length:267 start_codon:yes stop_codon:yes gene_type:complete